MPVEERQWRPRSSMRRLWPMRRYGATSKRHRHRRERLERATRPGTVARAALCAGPASTHTTA